MWVVFPLSCVCVCVLPSSLMDPGLHGERAWRKFTFISHNLPLGSATSATFSSCCPRAPTDSGIQPRCISPSSPVTQYWPGCIQRELHVVSICSPAPLTFTSSALTSTNLVRGANNQSRASKLFVQKQGAGLNTNGITTPRMRENVFGTNRSFLGPKGFFDMYIT